ncbi:MAG TPA: CTP synthase, partial [Saprospiraceae bacterium]|nr:CTP synthase [Saprospiraceae bacterium]
YNELQDAYKSIYEAFIHAGASNLCKVNVIPIHAEKLIDSEKEIEKLNKLDGILVSPGFGERGLLGKLVAIKKCREEKIPFFGICLGMQCAVVEFARNAAGLTNANTTEADPNTEYPVIDMMESQKALTQKGGTMRLGSYKCELLKNSKAFKAYGQTKINERHRHRFEFNNQYINILEENGLKATGHNPETGLVEIVEIPDHPWFVGVQYHPELKSTVEKPHPLFVAFVKAAIDYKESQGK